MIIVLCGPSCSGKSTIEKELGQYGYKKIVSYTTRERRKNETDGVDYHFIKNESFRNMLNRSEFAEYDSYSQERFYGTKSSDYHSPGDKVVVLTPEGIRQLKQNLPGLNYIVVYVTADLGTRIIRYIERCGINSFTFDDKNEICARVERDYAMFRGIEREATLVIENNLCDSTKDLAKQIHEFAVAYNQ